MKHLTEDAVRRTAAETLGLSDSGKARAGTGQVTTFNQLGFPGVADKPDGWYLPHDKTKPALILEVKASSAVLGQTQADELLKNIRITQTKYKKVVGVLYNSESVRVFKGEEEVSTSGKLEPAEYYLGLFAADKKVDKELIFELTAKINHRLHYKFGIKNLYHRMVFTACALVAKRYGALMVKGMDYSEFHNAILNSFKKNKSFIEDKKKNHKLELLVEVFSEIKMNLDVNSDDETTREQVRGYVAEFIDWITEISESFDSNAWRGEDVMGIFFNEFNRYKVKSEAGQVFTPEHIADFMYRILEVNKDDRVLDAACGSGGFLVKAMANMICEAGGPATTAAGEVKQEHLFGIEFDREIYALACANMLIHQDGKTNLEQLDARSEEAGKWISQMDISKVLMNPPFEDKHGCLEIVENVLDHVPRETACAFILPDKKLEKRHRRKRVESILRKHRLVEVVKLPENIFAAENVTTSVFVFKSGVPQNGEKFFACHMKSDGFETVKNKGRHDTRNRWPEIEKKWVEIVKRRTGDGTCQWNDPAERLSYRVPEPPFEVFEEDFTETQIDRVFFKREVKLDASLSQALRTMLCFARDVESGKGRVAVKFDAGGLCKRKIDTGKWKPFQIGDLFEVCKGTRLTKSDMEPGHVRFIGASALNNGCTAYVGNTSPIHPANVITTCYNGSVGATFFQDEPFFACDDVNILKPRFEMDEHIALFLVPLVKTAGARYDYNDKWCKDAMEKSEILLPVAEDGRPDWEFMHEHSMKARRKVEEGVKLLGIL